MSDYNNIKVGEKYYLDEPFGKIKRALGISNPFIETFPVVEIVEIKGAWVKYKHCTGTYSSSNIRDFKKFYTKTL